jgi:hypothetical protein
MLAAASSIVLFSCWSCLMNTSACSFSHNLRSCSAFNMCTISLVNSQSQLLLLSAEEECPLRLLPSGSKLKCRHNFSLQQFHRFLQLLNLLFSWFLCCLLLSSSPACFFAFFSSSSSPLPKLGQTALPAAAALGQFPKCSSIFVWMALRFISISTLPLAGKADWLVDRLMLLCFGLLNALGRLLCGW